MVLLLFLILPQDTPAVTYRKIGEAIQSARTLSVKYSYDFLEARDGKETVTHGGQGVLLVGEGNRIHTWVDMKMDAFGSSFFLVSDGKQMRLKFAEDKTKECPPDLREFFTKGLAREGAFLDLSILMLMAMADAPRGRLSELEVAGVSEGKPDGEHRGLVLTLRTTASGKVRPVEVWYDPKTLKVVRRRLETHAGKHIVERYTEWTVNPEIPAGTFHLDAKRSGPAPEPSPALTEAELVSGYVRAKIGVAKELKKAGHDEKALAAVEELILIFPAHERTKEAVRLHREWKKE